MITNQTIRLDDYQPHPRNYNAHSEDQIGRLAKSLSEFGQVRSIIVWRNTILAGHGVVEAAKLLGWTELRADVLDESWNEDRALAYLVADNELARRSDPDQVQLATILEELQTREPLFVEAAGYTHLELEQLLAQVASGFAPNDPMTEWRGMPEFEQEDRRPLRSILVHFERHLDVDDFSRLIHQTITDKTKFIWYPYKERVSVIHLGYQESDESEIPHLHS